MPKKKKEATVGLPEEDDDDYPDLDIRPERWVNLRVKFVTWNFPTGLDFGMKVRSSTRLNAIVDKIQEKYGGSIMDVILYRQDVHPQNMLLDLSKTLDEGFSRFYKGFRLHEAFRYECAETREEAGFEGGKAKPSDPLPDIIKQSDHPSWEYMWYDYKAHTSECALLLSSPRGASRKDIAKKVEMELEQEAKVKAALLKSDQKKPARVEDRDSIEKAPTSAAPGAVPSADEPLKDGE